MTRTSWSKTETWHGLPQHDLPQMLPHLIKAELDDPSHDHRQHHKPKRVADESCLNES